MDRKYLFVLFTLLHIVNTKTISNYLDGKNTITEDERRGSSPTEYLNKGELQPSETFKHKTFSGSGGPSTRTLFYLPPEHHGSSGGTSGHEHSYGSIDGGHFGSYGGFGDHDSHGGIGGNRDPGHGTHNFGSSFGSPYGGGYGLSGQGGFSSSHGNSFPSSHGNSFPSGHDSGSQSSHGSGLFPTSIGFAGFGGGHGGHDSGHGNEHGHGGSSQHGTGHQGTKGLAHALALKGILIPLAGIALLGAAAALTTNPVLLQLGVLNGRRRRRRSIRKEFTNIYDTNSYLIPHQNTLLNAYEK